MAGEWYLAVVLDRHMDPLHRISRDREAAIKWARETFWDLMAEKDGIVEYPVDGYEWCAQYTYESDHAYVVKVDELSGSGNDQAMKGVLGAIGKLALHDSTVNTFMQAWKHGHIGSLQEMGLRLSEALCREKHSYMKEVVRALGGVGYTGIHYPTAEDLRHLAVHEIALDLRDCGGEFPVGYSCDVTYKDGQAVPNLSRWQAKPSEGNG